MNAFTGKVNAAGATVLDAAGSHAERDQPLGVLSQLFRSPPLPPTDHERVAWLFPGGMLIRGPDAVLTASGQLPTRVIQDLWVVLHTLSQRVPVVISIDDIQFGDGASLRCLLYFGSQLRSSRVLMVVTESTSHAGMDASQAAWHTDLLRQPHCHRIRLAPLSREGVAELLSAQFGRPASALPAARWHEISGGNPLLLQALIEDYHDSADGSPARLVESLAGTAFGRAVLTCLHRGDPGLLRIARGLAILDGSGSRSLLRRLIDADEPSTDRFLEVLNNAGLLDAGRFRHPAARSAVLAEISPDDRSRMHRRAARLLHGDGGSSEKVALHLVAARHAGEACARQVLREAAEQALQQDRLPFAAECLRLASPACTDDEEHAAVALLRARVESASGDRSTLTAAERQAAALAASGHTNRQIAQKLHITVSTVEQHLTRAYRKLHVNGRADLQRSFSQTIRQDYG